MSLVTLYPPAVGRDGKCASQHFSHMATGASGKSRAIYHRCKLEPAHGGLHRCNCHGASCAKSDDIGTW